MDDGRLCLGRGRYRYACVDVDRCDIRYPQDTGREDVMQLALAGKPALAALRLAVDLSGICDL